MHESLDIRNASTQWSLNITVKLCKIYTLQSSFRNFKGRTKFCQWTWAYCYALQLFRLLYRLLSRKVEISYAMFHFPNIHLKGFRKIMCGVWFDYPEGRSANVQWKIYIQRSKAPHSKIARLYLQLKNITYFS